MLVVFSRLDYYIVDVVLEAPMHHIMKNDSHGTLIDRAYILRAKGHDCVMKLPMGVRKAIFSASNESILIWL